MKKTHKIAPPIRIVYITTVPKSFNQLRGQLRYLGEHGFDVHCISSPGPELEIVRQHENVQIHPVHMYRSIRPLSDLLSAIKIVLIFIKLRPNIVHAGTPKAGFIGIVVAKLVGIPTRIFFYHGFRFISIKGWKRSVVYLAEKLSCLLASRVYCNSKSLREQCIDFNLCPQSKIIVPLNGSVNGVDAREKFNPQKLIDEKEFIRKKFQIPKDAIVIGFVGRIVKDKGFVELIHAWHRIREKVSNLHLLIVGPFEPEDPIPLDVRNVLKSDSRIHLAGLVLNPAPYYTAMDIYVLPSHREGFGTTSLEAAAMELPVVTTQIPGCIDAVVDGVTGKFVDVRDSINLYNALLNYCENSKIRKKHGLNGRKRVLRDFQPEGIWKFMTNEYYSLINRMNMYADPVNRTDT